MVLNFTEKHVKLVHFYVKRALWNRRIRRISNSIPIPDFGIEYPVPGIDSGRPTYINIQT